MKKLLSAAVMLAAIHPANACEACIQPKCDVLETQQAYIYPDKRVGWFGDIVKKGDTVIQAPVTLAPKWSYIYRTANSDEEKSKWVGIGWIENKYIRCGPSVDPRFKYDKFGRMK